MRPAHIQRRSDLRLSFQQGQDAGERLVHDLRGEPGAVGADLEAQVAAGGGRGRGGEEGEVQVQETVQCGQLGLLRGTQLTDHLRPGVQQRSGEQEKVVSFSLSQKCCADLLYDRPPLPPTKKYLLTSQTEH